MNARELRRLFRDIVGSVAAPVVLGTIGCSAAAATPTSSSDAAAEPSTSTEPDADDAPSWPATATCADYATGIPDAVPFWDGGPLEYQDEDETPDAEVADAGGRDGGPCDFHLPLPCDAPQRFGWLSYDQCIRYCSPLARGTCLITDEGQGPILECSICGGGRRPEGFVSRLDRATRGHVARYLSAMAELEAASIAAFERLRVELAAHGAPASLLQAVARAARDERQHARTMRSLARQRGAVRFSRAHRTPRSIRPLVDIAEENAVEGCVRETYGALVATWQGQSAHDEGIREAMRRIARDETRHAALAWRVRHWIASRLTRDERARVAEASARSLAGLYAAAQEPIAFELLVEAGLPSPSAARRLIAELVAGLGTLSSAA